MISGASSVLGQLFLLPTDLALLFSRWKSVVAGTK